MGRGAGEGGRGLGAGLPTTSRYCRTTLLGSGPRKRYTSRIPPVDLQLRAGLGCRTTSRENSPGAQGQMLTTRSAGQTTAGEAGSFHSEPGAQNIHSEPEPLKGDAEQLDLGPPFWPQPASGRDPKGHLRSTKGQSRRPQPTSHFLEE